MAEGAEYCSKPEEAGKKIEGSQLSDSDKEVASKLLEDTKIFRLPRKEGSFEPCLPGDLAVDNFMFRGGQDGEKLAESLNVPGDKVRKPEDITHVILDSDGGGYDHSFKAQEALQSADPSIKDSSILNLWMPKSRGEDFTPEHAVLHNPEDRHMVTEVHNYMPLVNKDLATAAEFSKMAVENGGKPPTYIMPIVLNPYHLALGSEDAGDPFAITPKELGVKPMTDADIRDPKYRDSLVTGLQSLAESGDYRAKSILESINSMNKLADTGSEIFLSSSNHDKMELATYISSFHDNIYSATSTDRHGDPVDFNKRTAKFTEVSGSGVVLGVPKALEGQIDKTDLPHAVIHNPFKPDPLAGAEVKSNTITEPELNKLVADIKNYRPVSKFQEVTSYINHGASSIRYEGEPAMMESVVAEWDTLTKINEKAGNPIDLSKATTQEERVKLVESIMRDRPLQLKLEDASGELIEEGLEKLGYNIQEDPNATDPYDKHRVAVDTLLTLGVQLEQHAQGKLFTYPQVQKLREALGHPSDAGTEPRTEGFIYRPNDLSGSRVSTYLKVDTKDGRKVAIPFEYGNSFGAPYAAGLRNRAER